MEKVVEKFDEKELKGEIENMDSPIVMEKVRVKEDSFPVRYKDQRYYPGEELYIKPEHFDENLFEKRGIN